MIFAEIKYTIVMSNIKDIYEVIDAIREDPSSELIQEENIKREQGLVKLEITVLLPPKVAGESIVRMFPSVEKALFPLSWKEKNKQ